MPRNWLFFCVVFSLISAFAGTVSAQPVCPDGFISRQICDTNGCSEKYCEKAPPKVRRPPVKKIYLPPPAQPPVVAPPPAQPPVVVPPATPLADPKSKIESPVAALPAVDVKQDPTCKVGEFVVDTKNGRECLTASAIVALKKSLEARLADLKKAQLVVPPPKPEDEIKKIQRQLEDLGKAIDDLPNAAEKAIKQVGELRDEVTRTRQIAYDTRGIQDVQSRRLDEQDHRLQDMERGGRRGFGVQISGVINFHTLRPYDQWLWGAGAELALLPALTERWRLLGGAGAAYAGKDNSGDHLTNVTAFVGAQVRLTDELAHLAFGVLTEQRFAPSGLADSSYGGFVEPKVCPGNDGPLMPHRVCFGLRLALEDTVFQGPQTGELFQKFDTSIGLSIGYAYLPGL